MRIRINRAYTEAWMVETIKDAMKDFKAMYTDGDLKRAFEDATGIKTGYNADIIRCNVEAFDAGYVFGHKPSFAVDMLMEKYDGFTKIHFYVDADLNVDTRTLKDGTKLYSVQEYKEI